MNQKQLQVATQSMINWLADEHELGKAPYKIECTGTFEYEGLRFYMFKYKVSLFGKWLLGVAGGFEGDDLEPCGHTFSEQNLYHESTAQADCIAMVDMIMEYWKRQAAIFIENAGDCIISQSIYTGTTNLRWIYREESINPNDNGWRAIGDGDTEAYLANAENALVVDYNTLISIEPAVYTIYDLPVGTDLELHSDENGKYFTDRKTGNRL